MDVSRRSFLRGALALTAVTIAPALPVDAAAPRIVGDGVHDDWAGLQAAIDGKPFQCEGFVMRSPKIIDIKGGRFALSKPLKVAGRHRSLHMRDCDLLGGGTGEMLVFDDVENCSIVDCRFEAGDSVQIPNGVASMIRIVGQYP